MLTKLTVRNFKRFDEVEIELGSPVAFIGPNNSGKTSAMQALALWDIGLKRWNEKHSGKRTPEKRPGVTVNRRDLVSIPVPSSRLLWRDLHVRNILRSEGRQETQNVRIDVIVEGVTGGRPWNCGLEFDYANEESFFCRPLRLSAEKSPHRMEIPDEAGRVQIAFLPPMSGLAATEIRLEQGAINVRVGEGRTADVLRNLCLRIYESEGPPDNWSKLANQIQNLFGVKLEPPQYITERGEISMSYQERDVRLDLSSSGRGLQQTMLILAYLYANPGAVLMLDEPDAHLEILRQRQIYQIITSAATESGSQIIAASHSEVLLDEAAGKDMVVAFIREPIRIDDQGSQLLKSLRDIGFEHYYQAEQTGWVLYLEGSTDLSVLQAFARRLKHSEAARALARPYVHYVGNNVAAMRHHYYGLKEAIPDLKAVALFDRIESGKPETDEITCLSWRRREIENYLCSRATLVAYARSAAEAQALGPLFAQAEIPRHVEAMLAAMSRIEEALRTLGKGSPWEADTKVSDDFLTPVFEAYFEQLGLPNLMRKKSFYELAEQVPQEEIDPEISEKLDAIASVASSVGTENSDF